MIDRSERFRFGDACSAANKSHHRLRQAAALEGQAQGATEQTDANQTDLFPMHEAVSGFDSRVSSCKLDRQPFENTRPKQQVLPKFQTSRIFEIWNFEFL